MAASIVGFKDPRADLHRKSPKIFAISMFCSILFMVLGIQVPFTRDRQLEAAKKAPPVIIQIENIPETHHVVRAPAPKLGMPLEVEDEFMPDDITIESTDLDLSEISAPPPVLDIQQEEPVVEEVEEEIFELFAVEEQPERINEVAPEYPEAASRAGIEGIIFIRALVDKTGKVTKAEVLKGPDELHQAALDAALKTTFKPAKQNDMPVSCWVQMSFRFELE